MIRRIIRMKRRKQWLLLPAVLLALVLSGCAGGASGSGEAAAAAVPAEITESSLNETGEEEEPHFGTEANEETEKQQRTDTARGETDVRETDNTYEVDIDLPGFKKEDININYDGRKQHGCQQRSGGQAAEDSFTGNGTEGSGSLKLLL